LNHIKPLLLILFLFISFLTKSEKIPSSILGVKIGDEYSSIISQVGKNCTDIDIKQVHPVKFPLANLTETHIICKQLTDGGEIAITIADGKAIHIYGKNIDDSLIVKPNGETKNYLNYIVYQSYLYWEHQEDHSITLISKEALHPNLFVWKNPYLESNSEKFKTSQLDAKFPPVLRFGSTLKNLKPIFEKHCIPLEIIETDVWLENHPNKQIQVNCFNYNFLGFPRKIEAIFGDDILELAWILTTKQEESRIKDALIDIYGRTYESSEHWDVFYDGRVYLRKDKPEVLAISSKLVPLIRKKYNLFQ